MTEAEWQGETQRPQWMVHILGERKVPRTKAGRRKLRLFACACCRLAWSRLPDARLGQAVEVAERFADGLCSKNELAAAREQIDWMRADGALPARTPTYARVAVDMAVETTDAQAYSAAFYMTATQIPLAGQFGKGRDGDAALCALLRDVFGNPFRPATLESAWLTPTVASLAQAVYDERIMPSGALDPARASVLADALEDAGCADERILSHLRGPGPHVRGSWVVDLSLGRS